MKAWPKLSGCVLLLVGCRQPNPEWTGNDSSDPDGGPGNGMTEGQSCSDEDLCPDGWVCGPMGCQEGIDGDPCEGSNDCQDPTPVCSFEGMCHAGGEGDPCVEDTHCAMPTGICGPAMTCQSGEAGQPCRNRNHCAAALDCTNDVCG